MTTLAEIFLLTLVLFQESSIQTEQGQELVAWVTVNRMQHDWYPDHLQGVIYQPHQYEWVTRPQEVDANDKLTKEKWGKLQVIAKRVLDNRNNSPEPCLLNFHDTSYTPKWAKSKRMKLYKQVKNQRFYIDTECTP